MKDCKAYWEGNKFFVFSFAGWNFNVLEYKYKDGYYYKYSHSRVNTSARGESKHKRYKLNDPLTEDQVLKELSETKEFD